MVSHLPLPTSGYCRSWHTTCYATPLMPLTMHFFLPRILPNIFVPLPCTTNFKLHSSLKILTKYYSFILLHTYSCFTISGVLIKLPVNIYLLRDIILSEFGKYTYSFFFFPLLLEYNKHSITCFWYKLILTTGKKHC